MTYTGLRLRESLKKYAWVACCAAVAVLIALVAGSPRMALALTFVCFALFLFLWTRVWVELCATPSSPLWRMNPQWHSEPEPGILLAVDFTHDELPPARLEIRHSDISKTEDTGKQLILFLNREPRLLIVPADEITPELRLKLLQ